MAHPAREDTKHLDKEQAELVSRSRHPGLRDEDPDKLTSLEKSLREHREKCRGETRSQGAKDEGGFGGRRRAQILNQAVKRVSRERGRRDRHLARSDLREFAADVMGRSMDKKAPKRGTAKGHAKAANRREKGESGDEGRKSPLAAD